MANAKKCDICGKLYESSSNRYRGKINNNTLIVTINITNLIDDIDLCNTCIDKIFVSISKLQKKR